MVGRLSRQSNSRHTPLPASSIYKFAAKHRWLMLLPVGTARPDHCGMIRPGGLTDPDSLVPVGSVISVSPNECRDKASGGAGPVKHRGEIVVIRRVRGPRSPWQFVIQIFGRDWRSRAAIARCEILSGLSSFRRSTNDASTSLCQIGWRLGKRIDDAPPPWSSLRWWAQARRSSEAMMRIHVAALVEVKAPDETAAMEKAASEFKVPTKKADGDTAMSHAAAARRRPAPPVRLCELVATPSQKRWTLGGRA
jgi:hypothetical protein